MELLVNGRPMGSTVPIHQEAYVRMSASARHPVSRVLLVADGEVVWSSEPDRSLWEARFFLPLAGRTYVRAILESAEGGYRTMGNPVFLVADSGEAAPDIPQEDLHRSFTEAYLEVDGALEASSKLAPPSLRTVLGEWLKDPQMRHPTVWALQNREDLIPITVLQDLLAHPDREIRLGTAYAMVVRGPPDLATTAVGMLSDADVTVREYAARMLLQYSDLSDNSHLIPGLDDPGPAVRMYLTRALSTARFDPDLTAKLIHACRSAHHGESRAAFAKLSEMGTLNYRVIRALIDSGRAGSSQSLDLIGWIGERRAIPELEAILGAAAHGPVRRSAFLALNRMGAPYPERLQATCPWTPQPPRIDGHIDAREWESSTLVAELVDDWDGTPAPSPMWARIAHDARHLYLSFQCERPPAAAPNTSVRRHDDPGLLEEDRLEWAIAWGPGAAVFSVSPLGVLAERRGGNWEWNPVWEAASAMDTSRWCVESAVPLSALQSAGSGPDSVLSFNVSYVNAAVPRRWSWSVTYGSPEKAERFGDLSLTGTLNRP